MKTAAHGQSFPGTVQVFYVEKRSNSVKVILLLFGLGLILFLLLAFGDDLERKCFTPKQPNTNSMTVEELSKFNEKVWSTSVKDDGNTASKPNGKK